MKQCISKKFCFDLGSTAFDTCEMLKRDVSANALVRAQTFEWFSVIRLGEYLVEDCECLVCPSTVTLLEMWRVFADLSIKPDKAPFWRLLAG